jgi:hypothetical protein
MSEANRGVSEDGPTSHGANSTSERGRCLGRSPRLVRPVGGVIAGARRGYVDIAAAGSFISSSSLRHR